MQKCFILQIIISPISFQFKLCLKAVKMYMSVNFNLALDIAMVTLSRRV